MIGKAALALALLIVGQTASAHRVDEYLQATMLALSVDRIQASMRMIPGVQLAPEVIANIDENGDGVFSEEEQRAYALRVVREQSLTMDGQAVRANVLSWSFPPPAAMREGLGEIHIEYASAAPRGGANHRLILTNHYQNQNSVYLMNVLTPEDSGVRIMAQKRNERQTVYELDYEQMTDVTSTATAPHSHPGGWHVFQGAGLFRLGMRHIAKGTDHLLFLLTLLLPAPLIASASRWGPPATLRQSVLQILKIVTAFTIGHSLTLALAALGTLHVPGRPIEVLIAVSILVSALHAWRPLAAGAEVWIAGCFGLIHGLAFASTLERLELVRWQLVAGIVSFNLGIEAMQLLFVAALLPSLILLSRTRAYAVVRNAGALFAAASALAWIIERLTDVTTPIDAIMDAFASNGTWIAISLFLTGLTLNKRSPA